ncbi:MAG: hypothetical protein ACD_25C00122G0004 [uncultured bacterium]|uniref:Flap endonuclease n=1 Tax=candidate division WWE3 bacterium TaxID=2053526 RepID=A0A656PN51_UNCKA|nr:hypothetical protein P147_WWE3C00001G0657 [candidate division WWE3 bacterium RAAC2_WWE3_1]EKD94977.1 MAG: hypothetical protein ACD_25C00122G0004 [uncultured bacterium]KKS29375.1 MAG: hypothetical protein UU91_C0006G0028 [candidate division WWE3 bacterium GW2011_GWB1_42_117]KKS54663.1 MAG: hypothetical protein UV21_C0005G0027 [candidate division WWE3 bacterium GW2011_GWD2_42_34]KKT04895.1 MAG: hypothetical protein UV83_C0008G0029 [candidate division WWE3 bacterium GW2011_GWE2_43_18]KKT06620.
MPKLLLIDTFNFLHRAYHALPPSFRDANGEPTNALYGVTSMLINMLTQVKPDYLVAALDGQKPTFRVEDFTAYKAHRKPMEDSLASQIPKTLDMLSAFGVKQVLVDGYEADDIIATLALGFSGKVDVIIASNDRDLWQLAGKNVMLMVPDKQGKLQWVGKDEVSARLGFPPDKIADYKGLRGDPSDNIPGVYGIGEKTAIKLIEQFGSVEDVYRNIEKVTPESLKEKLLENYEQALMSKKLATLIMDVPAGVTLNDVKYPGYDKEKVLAELSKYNFKSLMKRLGLLPEEEKKSSSNLPDENQLGLF